MLKELPITPDPKWQQSTLSFLLNLGNDDVPKSRSLRNNIVNVFNLLFIFTMSAKAKKLTIIATMMVVFVVAGAVTVKASENSSTGDFLYPVDKGWESLRRAFISGEAEKAEFEMNIFEERLGELNMLQEQNESQSRIEAALGEVEKQQSRVQERVREMEEKHMNGEVDDGVQERVMNRYENQVQNYDGVKEQVQNQYKEQNQEGKDSQGLTVTGDDDSTGEPGGVGNQQRPQDRDSDGNYEENSSGDGRGGESWD